MAWYKPKDVIKKTREYVSDALDSAKDHGVDIKRVAMAFATGGFSEVGRGVGYQVGKLYEGLLPEQGGGGYNIKVNYPSSDDSSVKAAQDAEAARRKKALGRAAMILTSGKTLGQADVKKQTLLGA